MNEECHRPSILANEFGEVVKTWKIPNELQGNAHKNQIDSK